MRQILSFDCEGTSCVATLDSAAGSTGLLIVSGGNEIRAGSHRGMVKLAADLQDAGFPVFRYDRRGVGDSAGINEGYLSSAPDIAAALTTFRAEQPQLKRIVAFGNCDAATALLLFHSARFDALFLTNPWIVETESDTPAPAAARAYYAQRLRDPRAWLKLLRGRINLRAAAGGLSSAAGHAPESSLATRVAAALATRDVSVSILLAAHDGTAVDFLDQWHGSAFDQVRSKVALATIASASHSFAAAKDYAQLRDRILAMLRSL